MATWGLLVGIGLPFASSASKSSGTFALIFRGIES